MKIAIVGAGAIGGLLAGCLADSGHDVSLVARGIHLEALQTNGLRLRWLGQSERTYRLPAVAEPARLGPQDAVFIALKAYAIGDMLPRIVPLMTEETVVVPAINGLPWWYFQRVGGPREGQRIECLDPDGSMIRALDPNNIIGCVVHAAGEVVAPGIVEHTSSRLFILGELDGAMTARLDAIGSAMRDGGLEPKLTHRIRNEIWMKLIGNLSYNPLAALTLSRMNEINQNEDLLETIRILMGEAMAVSEAYGEAVTLSIEGRIAIAKTIGNSKISMHQDLERGRPMEIDAIIGSVAELAKKAHLSTPMIDAFHALIKARARH
ncbi:MAG: ketopantoate reductase family protein [Burkholderiales bacterium]